MTRILGVDPGLQRTGWGIISYQSNRLSYIGCGVITSDRNLTLALRIHQLYRGLAEVIEAFNPQEAAMEETFVNANGSSTLKLGQARGGLLLTLTLHALTVSEYSANLVKKTVVGSGHADKQQIGMMVKMLLPGSNVTQADAADALAVAICHAHHNQLPVANRR